MMEHYSAIKRKMGLTPTATVMNPENLILREKSQSQKCHIWVIPLIINVHDRQIHKDKK